jgi:hypothetical protein
MTGLVLLPIAGILSAQCGGNDVVDSADALADGTVDGGTLDAALDANLADRQRETSSEDSGMFDARTDAEAALLDAEGGSPMPTEGGDADGPVNAGDAEAGFDGGVVVAPPGLGTSKTFAVLAGTTVTNSGATTAITGDVGVWPGTAVAGPPSGQVNGTIHPGDGAAMQAEADLTTAYNNLAGRPCLTTMTSVDLGGKTLGPGVYCFASSAAQTVGDLTLDGQGNPNAVWIFQIGSTLTISTNVSTVMINQGNACNVYWQVGSSATINGGAQFKGNILAQVSISLLTNANVSPGRTLTQMAAVSLLSNTISNAGCP